MRQRSTKISGTLVSRFGLFTILCVLNLIPAVAQAQQPPPPCHPNRFAERDMETIEERGDIRSLPEPLQRRLIHLAGLVGSSAGATHS